MDIAAVAAALLTALLALAATLAITGKGVFLKLVNGARDNWAFVLLLIVGFAVERATASVIDNLVTPIVTVSPSSHILTSAIIALQDGIPSTIGVPVLGAVYVPLFIFLLALVPLTLLSTDPGRFRSYTIALLLAYATCAAAHVLISSVRPGLDPSSGVAPLLYDDLLWGRLSAGLMGRGSSLPSTHMAEVTVMWMILRTERRAGPVMLIVLATMALAVLYLGAHWPIDVIAGVATGAAACLAASVIEKKMVGRRFNR